jgi:hypothetical protein
MARKNQTRETRFKKPKGVAKYNVFLIDNTVMDSEAFVALSATAIRMLLGFYRRRRWDAKKKRYKNLMDIVYTFDCMAWECNVSRRTVLDARNELIELGFINVAIQTQGQVFGEDRKTNIYEISDRYLKWHPDPDIRSKQKYKEHPPLKKKPAPKTAFRAFRPNVIDGRA